jgi:hypothetical protein
VSRIDIRHPYSDEESARLFKQAGVSLRRYNPKTHFSLAADESLSFEDLAMLRSAITFAD